MRPGASAGASHFAKATFMMMVRPSVIVMPDTRAAEPVTPTAYRSNRTVAIAVAAGSAMRRFGAVIGRTTSSIEAGMMQAMQGGARACGLAPIGNAVSPMPEMK